MIKFDRNFEKNIKKMVQKKIEKDLKSGSPKLNVSKNIVKQIKENGIESPSFRNSKFIGNKLHFEYEKEDDK